MGKLLLAVAGAVLCVLLPATPAAAHNSLTGSDPKNGVRLAKAPTNIRLTFLARLDPGTTKVTVTGPDNVPATAGSPVFAGSRVAVGFRPGAAGLYIVRYEVASTDGHPIKGKVEFTVTTEATPSTSPSPAVAASTTSAGTVSSPVAVASSPGDAPAGPAAVGAPAAGEDDSSWWPWALGGLLVLAALGGGLLFRRRTSTNPGAPR